MLESFPEMFQRYAIENEFMWAAVGAALLVQIRNLPGFLWHMFLRRVTYTITVCNEDSSSYQAMILWIYDKFDMYKFNAIRIREAKEDYFTKGAIHENIDDTTWLISIAFGNYFLWYKKYIPVLISASQSESTGAHKRFETITITFPRIAYLMNGIIEEIKMMNKPDTDVVSIIYQHRYEKTYIRRHIGLFNSLVLPDNTLNELFEDVKIFLDSEKRYNDKGIGYHRGYGFWGPPGTGKTTTAFMIAARFQLPIYILSPNSRLEHFLEQNTRFHQCIFLFEDIDLGICKYGDKPIINDGKAGGIDYKELINLIDGLLTPHGCIFIMTSNNKENIPSALIRPGRIDVNVEYRNFGRDEISRYIEFWYGVSLEAPEGCTCIPSNLKNLCMWYDDPQDLIGFLKQEACNEK